MDKFIEDEELISLRSQIASLKKRFQDRINEICDQNGIKEGHSSNLVDYLSGDNLKQYKLQNGLSE